MFDCMAFGDNYLILTPLWEYRLWLYLMWSLMSSHCSGFIPQLIVCSEHELIDFVMQFNARSESVKEKASFRRLIPKNRCLVAVEGYGHTLDCYHCYHVQLLHIDLLYLCCVIMFWDVPCLRFVCYWFTYFFFPILHWYVFKVAVEMFGPWSQKVSNC
jgi:hypothetical protein